MTKKTNRKKADRFAETLRPVVQELVAEGAGLRRIANCLNRRGLRPRFGERWYKNQVVRLLKRLDLKTKVQSGCDIFNIEQARDQKSVSKNNQSVPSAPAAKRQGTRLADFGAFAKFERPKLIRRKKG